VSAFGGARRSDGRISLQVPRSRRDRHRPGEEPDGASRCAASSAPSLQLPILFLTGAGLGLRPRSRAAPGADDYLTKDVSLPHLLARISAAVSQDRCAARAEAGRGSARARGLKLDAKRFTASWKRRQSG